MVEKTCEACEGNRIAAAVHENQRQVAQPAAALLMRVLVIGFSLGAMMPAHSQRLTASTKGGNKPSATRHSVQTASGRISYTEQGTGPVALFVHGVLLNGHL